MLVTANVVGFCILVLLSIFHKSLAIMVPTGKVGPITPRKMTLPATAVIESRIDREPAEVWERVDEGPHPFHPPVYKYTLLEHARKYGVKTLIPPSEEDYYRPIPRVPYYRLRTPVYYSKLKFYYSPLQFL